MMIKSCLRQLQPYLSSCWIHGATRQPKEWMKMHCIYHFTNLALLHFHISQPRETSRFGIAFKNGLAIPWLKVKVSVYVDMYQSLISGWNMQTHQWYHYSTFLILREWCQAVQLQDTAHPQNGGLRTTLNYTLHLHQMYRCTHSLSLRRAKTYWAAWMTYDFFPEIFWRLLQRVHLWELRAMKWVCY